MHCEELSCLSISDLSLLRQPAYLASGVSDDCLGVGFDCSSLVLSIQLLAQRPPCDFACRTLK